MTKKNYSTKDIYLAAVFLALGAKLERVDRADPRHQEFHFSTDVDDVSADQTKSPVLSVTRSVDFECIEKEYTNAELMVNAVKFKESIQRMKSLIHSGL